MTEEVPRSPGPFMRSTVNIGGITVDMEVDDPQLGSQIVGVMSDAVAANSPAILDQDLPIIIDGVQRGTIFARHT